MQHIPLLAKQLGKDFFSEQLVKLCVGWLGDDISTIRKAAVENLKVSRSDSVESLVIYLSCNHRLTN